MVREIPFENNIPGFIVGSKLRFKTTSTSKLTKRSFKHDLRATQRVKPKNNITIPEFSNQLNDKLFISVYPFQTFFLLSLIKGITPAKIQACQFG